MIIPAAAAASSVAAASCVAAAAMSGRPRRKGEATANRSIVAAGQYTLPHGPATLRHAPLQEPHSEAGCQVLAIGMCKPSDVQNCRESVPAKLRNVLKGILVNKVD